MMHTHHPTRTISLILLSLIVLFLPLIVTAQTAAPTVGQAKPAPTIMPTQEMPAAQGLD